MRPRRTVRGGLLRAMCRRVFPCLVKTLALCACALVREAGKLSPGKTHVRRTEAAARHHGDRALRGRGLERCRRRRTSSSCRRTKTPGGRRDKAVEAVAKARAQSAPLSRHRSCRACARRSARCTGSTRTGSSAGSGSDEVIDLLCQAYAGPGDEVIVHRARVLDVPRSSPMAVGRDAGGGGRARPGGRCRRDPRGGDRAHAAGVHRQPGQPDRHDGRPGRACAAGRRPCRPTWFWCSTGPMPSSSRGSTAARRWSTGSRTW